MMSISHQKDTSRSEENKSFNDQTPLNPKEVSLSERKQKVTQNPPPPITKLSPTTPSTSDIDSNETQAGSSITENSSQILSSTPPGLSSSDQSSSLSESAFSNSEDTRQAFFASEESGELDGLTSKLASTTIEKPTPSFPLEAGEDRFGQTPNERETDVGVADEDYRETLRACGQF